MLLNSLLKKRALIVALATQFGALSNAVGASCSTQSQMTQLQRDSLANQSRAMLVQVQNGDVQGLRANTVPAVAADFSGIMDSTLQLRPLLQRATITVDALYILDAAADPAGAARTDFFCGSPVVVMNFTDLPPATYALAILHATGVRQPQQISLILSRTSGDRWMLAGFFDKPMTEAGHDGLWYWTAARKFAQTKANWDAWFYYRQAAFLLDPADFLSSPHLENLRHESEAVHPNGLPTENPITLSTSGSAFTVTTIDATTAFGVLDLEVHYKPDPIQVAQLHNPLAARKQVTDIMLALLEQHPELRNAFHGIWVRADQGSLSLFALELPMTGIIPDQPSSNTRPTLSPR